MKIPLQFYIDLKKFLEDYKKYLGQVFPRPNHTEPVKELPMNQPDVLPPKPVPPKLTAGVDLKGHSFAWCGGTLAERRAMYSLAKKICMEEKLSAVLTRHLLATIWGESGWNQYCLNTSNRNGTTDYGLCQFNNGKLNGVPLWIGKGAAFKDAQEVIDSPEKCLRVMAREFKRDHAFYWIAYKNGSYKKYLDKYVA